MVRPTRPTLVRLLGRSIPAICCTCALISLLSAGCSGSRADRAPPADGPGSRKLVARLGDFTRRFLLTGELEAVRSEEIKVPRVSSWQTTIRWMEKDGSRVEAGQKVLEFDNSTFSANLEEKRLARDQAESDLLQKEAEIAALMTDKEFQVQQQRVGLEKARADAEVPSELLSRRVHQERQLALARARVAHEKALEELESYRQTSQEELEQKRIALDKARREIGTAERAIGELVLSAPSAGILVVADHPWEGRKLQIGDSVWVGLTVMRIPDLSEMRVEAALSDVDDGKVAAGMPVDCILDAYPELSFPGRITEITPVAQEPEQRSLRRSFKVAIALDRSDPERMRPGMSVKVEVTASRMESVVLAPREGLDLSSDPPRARLEGGEEVDVELGPCNALECVVEGGLEAGTHLGTRG